MFSFKGKIKNLVKHSCSLKKIVLSSLCLLGVNLLATPVYANNVSVSEKLISEVSIPEKISRVDNVELEYASYGYTDTLEATAYSPEEGWNITASGIPLIDCINWGCASNDYPLYSWIYIECPSAPWINGRYQVLDRMAYSGCIDLAMSTINECNSFGRRTVYVTQVE